MTAGTLLRLLLRILLLAVAFALGTAVVGWWAIPVGAVLFGIIARNVPLYPFAAGAGAAFGWVVLLAWAGLEGPVGLVAARVGGVFGMPGPLLLLLAILYPGLVALTGALSAGWAASAAERRRVASPVTAS